MRAENTRAEEDKEQVTNLLLELGCNEDSLPLESPKLHCMAFIVNIPEGLLMEFNIHY